MGELGFAGGGGGLGGFGGYGGGGADIYGIGGATQLAMEGSGWLVGGLWTGGLAVSRLGVEAASGVVSAIFGGALNARGQNVLTAGLILAVVVAAVAYRERHLFRARALWYVVKDGLTAARLLIDEPTSVLRTGCAVEVHSTQRPDLNGRNGRIVRANGLLEGRWLVQLGGGSTLKAFKPENLRPLRYLALEAAAAAAPPQQQQQREDAGRFSPLAAKFRCPLWLAEVAVRLKKKRVVLIMPLLLVICFFFFFKRSLGEEKEEEEEAPSQRKSPERRISWPPFFKEELVLLVVTALLAIVAGPRLLAEIQGGARLIGLRVRVEGTEEGEVVAFSEEGQGLYTVRLDGKDGRLVRVPRVRVLHRELRGLEHTEVHSPRWRRFLRALTQSEVTFDFLCASTSTACLLLALACSSSNRVGANSLRLHQALLLGVAFAFGASACRDEFLQPRESHRSQTFFRKSIRDGALLRLYLALAFFAAFLLLNAPPGWRREHLGLINGPFSMEHQLLGEILSPDSEELGWRLALPSGSVRLEWKHASVDMIRKVNGIEQDRWHHSDTYQASMVGNKELRFLVSLPPSTAYKHLPQCVKVALDCWVDRGAVLAGEEEKVFLDCSDDDSKKLKFARFRGLVSLMFAAAAVWAVLRASAIWHDLRRDALWRQLQATAEKRGCTATELEEEILAELDDKDLVLDPSTRIKFTAQWLLVVGRFSVSMCPLLDMRHTATTERTRDDNGHVRRVTYFIAVQYTYFTTDNRGRPCEAQGGFRLNVDSQQKMRDLEDEIVRRRELAGVRFAPRTSPRATPPPTSSGSSGPHHHHHSEEQRPQTTAPQKDHYSVLGLVPTATKLQIRRSYMRLALRTHPDKNLNDLAAAQRFHAVQAAYDVLSDDKSRRLYDDA